MARSGGQENRRNTGEGVARGKNIFAILNMITYPAACIRGTRVKDVVQRVQPDGQTCSPGHALGGGQHSCGKKNQQRMGKISRPKNTYAEEKVAKSWGE